MDKHLTKLTVEDLRRTPFWYFPVGESEASGSEEVDEFTVRPLVPGGKGEEASGVAVAIFTTARGRELVGYVYAALEQAIDDVQPTIVGLDDQQLPFYRGAGSASDLLYLERVKRLLPPEEWPIRYRGKAYPGLEAASGVLHGIYFYDQYRTMFCLSVDGTVTRSA